MEQQYPSKLLNRAVEEFSHLPGIGRKTALRLVLHLLRQDEEVSDAFAEAVKTLRHEVKYCKVCHNICDEEVCDIRSNPRRDSSTICVVENVQDVMAVENTQQYTGLYHVLGGVISPVDGVGPGNIEIQSLVDRVKAGGVGEVILALSPTMEGDTTNFYISRRLADTGVKLSVIARGVTVGDELEYTDEVTLGRSILNRTEFTGNK
ncbi:MAG: recombination mediator RecR [Bacteroidaceae bacterium]